MVAVTRPAGPYRDLRGALEAIERSGDLVRISREVEPGNELANVVRQNARLARRPALLFEQVGGFPGWRVATSFIADRGRACDLFGLPREARAFKAQVLDRLEGRLVPRRVEQAPCQENVLTEGFDLRQLIPWTHGANNVTHRYWQGPVVTRDPLTGRQNLAIYRTCVQGPRTVTVNARWDRHVGFQVSDAKRVGQTVPVAIVLGADPMMIPFAAMKLPYGSDDFAVLGSLRGEAVDLVHCRTVDLWVPAQAEVVIEGEIRPPYEMGDDGPWPEYLGYLGMNIRPPIVHVTAVTHRDRPINYMTIPGGSRDQNGLFTGALFLRHLRSFASTFVDDCTMVPSSVMHHAVIRVRKREPEHESLQLNVALAAFGFLVELDRVTLVDDDVDIYDLAEVDWAVATRCDPSRQMHVLCDARTQQIVPIAGVRSLDGEPIAKGKLIVDATIPWRHRVRAREAGADFFARSEWDEVDLRQYFPPADVLRWLAPEPAEGSGRSM